LLFVLSRHSRRLVRWGWWPAVVAVVVIHLVSVNRWLGWPPLLRSALVVVTAAAAVAAQVWAIGLLEPWAQTRHSLVVEPPTRPRPAPAAPVVVRPLAQPSGRFGMGRATLVLVFGGGWRSFWQALRPQLVTLACLLPAFLVSEAIWGSDLLIMRGWLLCLSCLNLGGGTAYLPRPGHPAGPSLFGVDSGPSASNRLAARDYPARLYLFGVDYRRQFRFNLAVCCLSPVLPLAAAAALLGSAGAYGPMVAVAGGAVLLRVGWLEGPVTPIDLAARSGRLILLRLLLFILSFVCLSSACLFIGTIFAPQAIFSVLWWIAGCLAAVGLAGLAYRLWADDETMLRRR
jgi:hypothetical protein